MTIGGFFAPVWLLGQFKLAADPGTLFLAHVISLFLPLVDGIIVFCICRIRKGDPVGWTATYFLAGWWVLVGISIFVFFGRPDNLFIDSLKGLILIVSAYKCCPPCKK